MREVLIAYAVLLFFLLVGEHALRLLLLPSDSAPAIARRLIALHTPRTCQSGRATEAHPRLKRGELR